MSIHSEDLSQHLTISAPGHIGVPMGPYTVAVLFRNIPFQPAFIWYGYRSDNFSNYNVYFDGDPWYNFIQWDANFDISDAFWRWIVVTNAAGNDFPTISVGDYVSTGDLVWQHHTLTTAQNLHAAINRFSIGDEFGNGFRGDLACLASLGVQMDAPTIEATFKRSSAAILSENPLFFVHWPEAAGAAGPFQDLSRDSGGNLNGGIEIIRAGTWTTSSDPPEFNFSLGRSGKVKRWNGTAWDKHPVERWTGTAWEIHPIKGYDGSSFVTAK